MLTAVQTVKLLTGVTVELWYTSSHWFSLEHGFHLINFPVRCFVATDLRVFNSTIWRRRPLAQHTHLHIGRRMDGRDQAIMRSPTVSKLIDSRYVDKKIRIFENGIAVLM